MLSLETPHFNKMGDLENEDSNDSIDDAEYQSALGTRPDLPDYLDDFLQDDAYEKILGKLVKFRKPEIYSFRRYSINSS